MCELFAKKVVNRSQAFTVENAEDEERLLSKVSAEAADRQPGHPDCLPHIAIIDATRGPPPRPPTPTLT